MMDIILVDVNGNAELLTVHAIPRTKDRVCFKDATRTVEGILWYPSSATPEFKNAIDRLEYYDNRDIDAIIMVSEY